MYHLLCFSKCRIGRENAAQMCKSIVESHNDINLVQNTDLAEEINSLKPLCQTMIYNRISDILKEIQKGGFQLLTEAARVIVHNIPENLQWKRPSH